MALIDYVPDEAATVRTEEFVDGADDRDREKVSLLRAALANNPSMLEAYTEFLQSVRYDGDLDPELKELAHVVVDLTNECEYCATSHTEELLEIYGLPEERVDDIAAGNYGAFDRREAAAMAFAEQVARDPKRVDDDDIERLHEAGLDDGDVVEVLVAVITAVASNTMVDALNVHVADRGGLVSGPDRDDR